MQMTGLDCEPCGPVDSLRKERTCIGYACIQRPESLGLESLDILMKSEFLRMTLVYQRREKLPRG